MTNQKGKRNTVKSPSSKFVRHIVAQISKDKRVAYFFDPLSRSGELLIEAIADIDCIPYEHAARRYEELFTSTESTDA